MSCRVALVLDTLRAPCCFARDAFYDTLYQDKDVKGFSESTWDYGLLRKRIELLTGVSKGHSLLN